jgi:hypothetical protein
MDTNGRFKVADHKARNGKPIAAGDTPKSANQSRGVGRKTLWGLSMVMVALFRFFMTWALNVTPEPVNVTLTSIIGVLGMMLFTWGRLKDRSPMQTPENSRHR